MNIALDTLAVALAGESRAAGQLLPACRAQAYGAEAFGGVAIVEMFARQPASFSATPHVVAGATQTAVFDTDAAGVSQAVFAEHYDGRVARIWRLGSGGRDPIAETTLRFAQDPFMSQARERTAFDPKDHPELSPEFASAVSEVLASMVEPFAEAQAIVLRAVSTGDLTAALVSVVTNTGDVTRTVGHALAGLFLRVSDGVVVQRHVVWDQDRTRVRDRV